MKKISSIFLFITVGILISVFLSPVQSQGSVGDIQNQINELERKLVDLGKQKNTLSSQIVSMDSQIKLTTLKIAQTQEEIDVLTQKIGRLEVSLDSLAKVLGKRIAETYKKAKIDSISLIFSTQKFTDLLNKYKYLKVLQLHDRKLMLSMEETKVNYDDQKAEVEKLKAKLESQKKLLAQQKKDKENLLIVTKNDEKKYQQLLAQAYAEKAALERALVAGTKVGPIKRGDSIALIGNTGYPGCSTGKHLHFEIRKNNNWTDPAPYLQNKTVEDDQNNGGGNVSLGSGSWPWPINDPIRVTQFYGNTPFSWWYKYSGGIHTGIDMITSSTDVIQAPADGILYRSSQLCGSSTINIVYIDHGDNLISFYLHVQ